MVRLVLHPGSRFALADLPLEGLVGPRSVHLPGLRLVFGLQLHCLLVESPLIRHQLKGLHPLLGNLLVCQLDHRLLGQLDRHWERQARSVVRWLLRPGFQSGALVRQAASQAGRRLVCHPGHLLAYQPVYLLQPVPQPGPQSGC